jgi:3-isopropylmalate/(R)-2-methylmalate dehydratase small subunit
MSSGGADIFQAHAEVGLGELEFSIDLEKQQVVSPDGAFFSFEVPETERARLLNGLDQIGATLLRAHAISNYQERDWLRRPWVYAVPLQSDSLT